MPLAAGDNLAFDGRNGQVVAVTATTDVNGRGSIVYGANIFQFRLLKAWADGATEFPVLATNDASLRLGLVLQDGSDPPLYCLCFDDLPAPGWGRWVQGVSWPSRWGEAWEFTAQDSVVFIVGWRPGVITIKRGGVAEVGGFADIVLTYSTGEGSCEAWWQPAYPHNDLEVNPEGVPLRGPNKIGRFKTDAIGRLWECSPSGVLTHIIFPKAFAALGQRAGDVWTSAPTPERILTKAEVWYLGESAEVTEGGAVNLNLAVCDLTINGPANAAFECFWYEGPIRASGTLNASGTATVTGLPVGTYTVELTSPSSYSEWLGRQDIDCPATGGSYTISFGGSWNLIATGDVGGRVYLYGSVPAPGLDVWCYRVYSSVPASGPNWVVCATTDGGGNFNYTLQSGPDWAESATLAVKHPTYGGVADADVTPGGIDIAWTPCLAARFACLRESNINADTEGFIPWGFAGVHQNFYLQPPPRLKSSRDGTIHDFSATGKGWVSEPLPRYFWSIELTENPGPPGEPPTFGPGNYIAVEPKLTYAYISQDGELLGASIQHVDDVTPLWATGGVHSTCAGERAFRSIGGKINGTVLKHSPSSLTKGIYREPERYGLETGWRSQPLEVRHYSPSLAATRSLTFCSWECAYCGGPVWPGPDGAYTRGYCVQCADFGVSTDGRAYFSARTLAPATDWQTTIAQLRTAGGVVTRVVTGWPRPEEYAEGDEYLVWDWQGFGIPRWVAVHIVLGSLGGGLFTDGESIADAETRLGRVVGAVQLKLVLTQAYSGTGKTVWVTATRAENGEAYVLTGFVPAGAQVGHIVLLRPCPHSDYPKPYSWYVDVTGAAEVSGDGYLACQIVNDGPSWRSSGGVIVKHHVCSPFACDVLLGVREPFLATDLLGRGHLVFIREGAVMHCTYSEHEGVRAPVNVTVGAGVFTSHTAPSIVCCEDGRLLVAATTGGATRLYVSYDDGGTWFQGGA